VIGWGVLLVELIGRFVLLKASPRCQLWSTNICEWHGDILFLSLLFFLLTIKSFADRYLILDLAHQLVKRVELNRMRLCILHHLYLRLIAFFLLKYDYLILNIFL